MIKLSENDKRIIANRKAKRAAKANAPKHTVSITHPSYVANVKVRTKREAQKLNGANTRHKDLVNALRKADKKIKNAKARGKPVTNAMIKEYRKIKDRKDIAYFNLDNALKEISQTQEVTQVFKTKRFNVHVKTRHINDLGYTLKGENEYARLKLIVLEPIITDTGSEYYVGDSMYIVVYPYQGKTIHQLSDILMNPYKAGQQYDIIDMYLVNKRKYKTKG